MGLKKIIFTNESATFILSALGKCVNDKGIIVDVITGANVTTKEGNEIPLKDFGGVKNGVWFTKNDLSYLFFG